jgi:sec-independent protein translocase protein TatB
MFDLSWSEMLLIVVVAVLVIGPKELPVAARTIAGWIRKIKKATREFTAALEDAVDDTAVGEVRNALKKEQGELESIIDLEGNERFAYNLDEVDGDLGIDIQKKRAKAKKKPAAKKTATKKAAPKKTVAKKPATKKSITKKTPPKKPAAKKTPTKKSKAT